MAPVYALDGALAPIGLLADRRGDRGRPRGLPAGDPARRGARRPLPRAPGAHRPGARAERGLPGHRAAARRRGRGRRRLHRQPQPRRRRALARRSPTARPRPARSAATSSSPPSSTTSARSPCPKEIINKAGPLDDEEWKVMRRHTIEGERMLKRVGGVLAEVGTHRPLLARALRRQRLPGRPGRRGDPDRGADRHLLRRLQRDDDDPLLPQGDAARGGDRRAAGLRRAPSSTPRWSTPSSSWSSRARSEPPLRRAPRRVTARWRDAPAALPDRRQQPRLPRLLRPARVDRDQRRAADQRDLRPRLDAGENHRRAPSAGRRRRLGRRHVAAARRPTTSTRPSANRAPTCCASSGRT